MASKKTVFNNSWLEEKNWRSWLTRCNSDPYAARCILCLKTFALSNMGKQAVISHEKSKTHVKNGTAVRGTDLINNAIGSTSHACTVATSTQQASTNSHDAQNQLPLQPNTSVVVTKFVIDSHVVKAEIMWCFKMIQQHMSMRSADGIAQLFSLMFPDSKVNQKFSLARTKASYTINFGLAKYFSNELKQILKTCEVCVVCFDESLNRVVQRGQMDLVVRFYDANVNQVITKYFTSTFLGHATAKDLLIKFCEAMQDVPLCKILQISMDGPSVNWSFVNKFEEKLNNDNIKSSLLHIGSFGLHVINGAFQTGHQVSNWQINSLLKAMYRLFKDVPARRAEYIKVTGKSIFPLKFCQKRWTQNVCVGNRALEILDDVCKFMKTAKLPKLTSVDVIKAAAADPLSKVKLATFVSIANSLEGFLTAYQTPQPMAPFMYDDITDLVKSLMQRFVKANVLETANSTAKLLKIDLDDTNNLLPRQKVVLGVAAQSMLLKSKASDLQKMEVQTGCRQFLVSAVKKMFERSPLKYGATRAVSCLNPVTIFYNRTVSESRMSDLLLQLHLLERITSEVADSAKFQFTALCQEAQTVYKSKFEMFDRQQRLDTFFSDILAGNEKTKDLWTVVKIVLIISHGNASVEGGFSINKELLIENMHEETIVSQRVVFDAIGCAGMDIKNIEITPRMMSSVRQSNSLYKIACAEKKEQQKKEEDRRNEEKKRKDMITCYLK